MTKEQDAKCKEFCRKAKEAKYEVDTVKVGLIMSCCKENKGHEVATLNKCIEFAKKYPGDDDAFIKALGELFGL